MDYQQYCTTTYMSIYKEALASAKVTDENSRKIQHIVVRDTTTSAYKESPSSTKVTAEKERKAQHIAIRDTTVLAIQKYPEIEPAEIWKTVHSAHLYRKAGIGLTKNRLTKSIRLKIAGRSPVAMHLRILLRRKQMLHLRALGLKCICKKI